MRMGDVHQVKRRGAPPAAASPDFHQPSQQEIRLMAPGIVPARPSCGAVTRSNAVHGTRSDAQARGAVTLALTLTP